MPIFSNVHDVFIDVLTRNPVAYASDNGVVKIEDCLMSNFKSPGTGIQRDARDDSRRSRSFIFVSQQEMPIRLNIFISQQEMPIRPNNTCLDVIPMCYGVAGLLEFHNRCSRSSIFISQQRVLIRLNNFC